MLFFGDGSATAPVSTASFIGIVVAITGNVIISFALNCQKLAHRKLENERNAELEEDADTYRSSVRSRSTSQAPYGGVGDEEQGANNSIRFGQQYRHPSAPFQRSRSSTYGSIVSEFDRKFPNLPPPGGSGAPVDASPKPFIVQPLPPPSTPSKRTNNPFEGPDGAVQFQAYPLPNAPGSSPFSSPSRIGAGRANNINGLSGNRQPSGSGSKLSVMGRRASLVGNASSPILEVVDEPTSPTGTTTSSSTVHMNEETANKSRTEEGSLLTRHGSSNGDVHRSNTADTDPKSRFSGKESETAYLKSRLWWIGFLLLNVGEFGNFLSYAFAPASVVAPLGAFALITNCFFAPLMLKERFRKSDIIGIAISIVGAVTIVGSSKSKNIRLDPDALIRAITRIPFIIYLSISISSAVVLSILSEQPVGQRIIFIDVGLCALFGGFTVLCTKAISTLLSKEFIGIFKEWITYPLIIVLLGTGIGQIRYLNRALMSFDSKVVVPIQFVMFNLSAIIGSAILYRDFDRITAYQFVVFLYGIATTFVGVFLLTRPDRHAEDTDSPGSSRATSPSRTATASTPLITSRLGRTHNGEVGVPVLRNRSSTTSLGLSPAYLLLATSTGGNPAMAASPPSSYVAVPVRSRTRSESRHSSSRQRREGEPGSYQSDTDRVSQGGNPHR